MIKLAHPEALYALFGLIPLIGSFVLYMYNRRKSIRRLGVPSLIQQLMPNKPKYKHQVKFILICLAYVCLVMAWANPQLGQKLEKVKRSGVDLVVAIDISRSMLAEDEKPSRLARAKQFVSKLIDNLRGDRIGIILFAGNAYLQVPLTSDYVASKSFLKTISTELAPTQGTAIAEAVQLAEKAYEESQPQFRSMVILSDGENHEPDAIEAAEEAGNAGTIIHTVGVGSPDGAPIPIYKNGVQDYKRTKEGSIVFSKLNEVMLKQVAAAGNGKYFPLSQVDRTVKVIVDEIAAMERQEFEERVFTDYEDQYQWFLALAIFLLVIEYFITERKNKFFSGWSIFQPGNLSQN